MFIMICYLALCTFYPWYNHIISHVNSLFIENHFMEHNLVKQDFVAMQAICTKLNNEICAYACSALVFYADINNYIDNMLIILAYNLISLT